MTINGMPDYRTPQQQADFCLETWQQMRDDGLDVETRVDAIDGIMESEGWQR